MSEPGEQQQQKRAGDGFGRTVAKKALAPIVATASTAVTAYAVRKGTELWQEKVGPKLAERGGGMAVASETLETVKEKLPVDAVKEKLPLGESSTTGEAGQDDERKEERRKREQRRKQRRKSLEQARSS